MVKFNILKFIKTLAMMMMMNCFCGMVDKRKAFTLISSLDYFRFCWMKLCSSDNHYTQAPQSLDSIFNYF